MRKTRNRLASVLLLAAILSQTASAAFDNRMFVTEAFSLKESFVPEEGIKRSEAQKETTFEEMFSSVAQKSRDSMEEINSRATKISTLHLNTLVLAIGAIRLAGDAGFEETMVAAMALRGIEGKEKAAIFKEEEKSEEIKTKSLSEGSAELSGDRSADAAEASAGKAPQKTGGDPAQKELKEEFESLEPTLSDEAFLGSFKVTAYSPFEDQWGSRTATGVTATEGVTIAVDPKVIPYGTKVYIEGVGVRIAQDCGGLVKGNKIDLYFETTKAMKSWGLKKRDVWIVYD